MTSSQKDDNKITSVMTRCIQHSILNLCNEQISFCRTLHVLGVLSLTIDSQEQEIIIKINDTLKKTHGPSHDGDDVEAPIDTSGTVTEAPMDSGSEAPTHCSTEASSGSDEEVYSTPISTGPCDDAVFAVKPDRFVQSDASDISLEDQGDATCLHEVDETPISLLKMRGRKQRRPIKVNNNANSSVTDKKPPDDDNTHSCTENTNNRVDNMNPDDVTKNNIPSPHDVGSDNLSENKRKKLIVNDDTVDNRSTTFENDTECTTDEPTLLAIDLIKRECTSPPLHHKESKSMETQMNCAVDCSSKSSAQLPKHFQTEDNRNTFNNYFHKSPQVVEVFPDEKWQRDESDVQPLSVRKLLTTNSHRSNSVIEHLERIEAFRKHGNLCLDASDCVSARMRLVMSQSRNLVSQISTEMSRPIIIEPIYQQSTADSYQHLQPIWSYNNNNVQETALNFSIQALNGEAEKDRRSPNESNQKSFFQSPPSSKQNVECMPNSYHLNLARHPDRLGEIRHAPAESTSQAQNSFIYGGYRIPSYDVLSNNFQSFFKRTDVKDVNASNVLLTRNITDESGVNTSRGAGYSSMFSRNAAMYQINHRLHQRRTLPGSLAWCPEKIHQKRIRKAIVNSNKGKKVTKFDDATNKNALDEMRQPSPQKNSGKIEGQYLVDSMSPETTRKRRRRGLDEALTSDEIAEYMGVEVDGTTPSCFACKYCTEESSDLCSYLSHTVTAHGSYICHQCAKIFTTKSSLLRHRPIHTGMRRFTCSICQRSFYRKDKCKAHIKKHLEMTGEDGETNRQEIINGFQMAQPINGSSILLAAPILSLAVQ